MMSRRPYNDPSSGVPKSRRDLIDRLVLRATLAAQASEPVEDVAANLATLADANPGGRLPVYALRVRPRGDAGPPIG
jgi:hypothetical protein